jgi:hypothetical protein
MRHPLHWLTTNLLIASSAFCRYITLLVIPIPNQCSPSIKHYIYKIQKKKSWSCGNKVIIGRNDPMATMKSRAARPLQNYARGVNSTGGGAYHNPDIQLPATRLLEISEACAGSVWGFPLGSAAAILSLQALFMLDLAGRKQE